MKASKLWKTVLNDLEVSISHGNFMTWIRPTQLVRTQQIDAINQSAEIACPSAYHRQFVEERYSNKIKEALDRITKKDNKLLFVVGNHSFNSSDQVQEEGPLFNVDFKSSQQNYREAVFKARLREDFTFRTFAVSSSNEMAHAAAQAIAKSPGIAYNPLFLYGGVGVGKTHLTQAVCHYVLKQNPEESIIYCTGEEFTNGIIEAIRRKQTFPFKKKYRSSKLLIIDDIQFIAGKTAVQEEFFHTFNALQQEGGQIVLVSDQPPHEIDGLENRLRSRFEGGLTIDIQQPNFELRTAILLIKSKTLGISLPMDTAQLIAANIESARRLEGFLTRLATESNLRKQKITESLVRALLGNVNEPTTQALPSLRPKELIKIIASHFNVNISQLTGPRRIKQIVIPRHLAMYLLRIELQLPFEEIGSLFGGRDHTTVMHAVEKITQDLSDSESLRIETSTIRKKIYR
jgi:chromosomal replication initiator protein